MYKIILIAITSLAAVSFLLPLDKTSAQLSEGIQVDYPIEDSILSLVFHPQIMLNSADEANGDRDEFVDKVNEQMGVNLNQLNQVVMQFGSNKDIGSDDALFIFSARFDDDVDVDVIQEQMFRNKKFESQEYAGHEILTSGEKYDPCLFVPQSDTILLAVHDRITHVIDNLEKVSKPEVLTRLHSDCDICGYLNFESNRENVAEILDMFFRGAPFDSDEFRDALLTLKNGHFAVNLKADLALEGTFTTGSDDDANAVKEQFEIFIEHFREAISENSLPDGMPAEFKEMIESANNGMMLILDNIKAETDRAQILITIKRDGGMAESLDLFIVSILAGMRMDEAP